MGLFKKEKPLEYKDIEPSIKFMMADEDETRRIIKSFADAIGTLNLEHKNIEYPIEFRLADGEEIEKIMRAFADAIEAFNKVVKPFEKVTK